VMLGSGVVALGVAAVAVVAFGDMFGVAVVAFGVTVGVGAFGVASFAPVALATSRGRV
jgi:hypothetical protein